MKLSGEAVLVRIFIGEDDRYQGRPLYRAIVDAAREQGLAGATVLKGVLGFGCHSRLHSASLLRLSEDLPIVIEIVDAPDKVEPFLARLDDMVTEGLVTTERVQVVAYRANDES